MAGWAACNSEQLGQQQDPVSGLGYLGEADFWNRSFQNWQSEMLAVGSMAISAVYLRQRGSPESEPVGTAHAGTGEEKDPVLPTLRELRAGPGTGPFQHVTAGR